MNEQNMNPEQIRLETVFQERERMTWDAAHGRLEQLPKEEAPKDERAEKMRDIVGQLYPDKPAKWKAERTREILAKQHAKRPTVPVKKTAPAPIEKKAKKGPVKMWDENGKMTKEFKRIYDNFPEPVKRIHDRYHRSIYGPGPAIMIRNTGYISPIENK